jgi:hypothetical protein
VNARAGVGLALLALACCRADPKPDAGDRAPLDVLAIGDARIEIELAPEPFALAREDIDAWVRDAASAVTAYYGRFPIERTVVAIAGCSGSAVTDGVTRGAGDHALIRIELGAMASTRALERDWMLTHEMVHLAMPDLPLAHRWFEEGIATYVEPIARAQAGLASESDAWRQLVLGLPQGQPGASDRGLDRDSSWGRTYWGGALFCLVADVEIRERTQNRHGLQDALRAIVAGGQSLLESSSIERVLARCDEAVGVPVMSELYARQALRAERVDLDSLWKRLGISLRRRQMRFDDGAPLADVRKAITRARP